MKKLILIFFVALYWCGTVNAADYLITDFGAKRGAKELSTVPIQKAIDQCTASGGGSVIVPAGDFLTGTIFLKNHVELYLESGARLLGSTNRADYPKSEGERGLIITHDAVDVSIAGKGEIDGNGAAFFKGDNAPDRPFLVLFKHCKQVSVTGIKLSNSAFWTFRLLYNDGVQVAGIQINSHVNFNNDGIDIDSRNVTISNCIIDTDDDALCFKSDSSFICQQVTVTNCVLASNCNFIKMGTASVGGFKNISISNCVLRRASASHFRFWERSVPGVTEPITGLAGIALEMVDGGVMDGIQINNIVMDGVQTPIFIRLGNRSHATGSLKNVMISHIIAKSVSRIASSITAIPGFRMENVVLRDIYVEMPGGGTAKDYATVVPEQEKAYPENRMFETALPAYGLYLRHVSGISLDHVQFKPASGEARPALYIEDGQHIRVSDLMVSGPVAGAPLVELNNVLDFMADKWAVDQAIPLLFRIRGTQSKQIDLNGLRGLSSPQLYELKDGAAKNALLKK